MGILSVVNSTMADNEVKLVSFGQPAGVLHIKSDAAAVVSVVGTNLGGGNEVVLSLDDGSTTIALVADVGQLVQLAMPIAQVGIKKVSGAGVISASVSAPGL